MNATLRKIGILIFFILSVITLYQLIRYSQVVQSPQRAYINRNDIKIEHGEITINDKLIDSESQNWNIEIREPRSYLSGIDRIVFGLSNNASNIDIGLSIDLKALEKKMKSIQSNTINLNDVTSGLFVHIKNTDSLNQYLGEQICESDFYSISFSPSETKIIGEIEVRKYSQSLKKIEIAGAIKLDTTILDSYNKNICADPNELPSKSIKIAMRNLSFSIDSPVIYEWSNKAGKTWRL